MNDYLLRSMIRQRHAQIKAEIRSSQLSRLERPRMECRLKKMISRFGSYFRQLKNTVGNSRPAFVERKRI